MRIRKISKALSRISLAAFVAMGSLLFSGCETTIYQDGKAITDKYDPFANVSPSPSATEETTPEKIETTTTVTAATSSVAPTTTIANSAPSLTSVSTLTGATEDTAFTITYAALDAAADEADPNGDTLSFRVEAVSTGTLTKSGSAVTAGTTLLGSGESLVWTPATNANGTLNAFTIKAWDGTEASSTAVQVQITAAGVQEVPTLTTISTLTGATEDTAFTITYAALAAAADEADVDGDTLTFLIVAVSTGTLTKGGAAVTAGTTTVGSGESLVWTPAANANGTGGSALNAFTLKAHDGTAASASAIQVKVEVAAVNDAPTLTHINALSTALEATAFTITYATLNAAADETDLEGDTLSFRIEAVSTGTLTKGGSVVTAGTTLISSGEEVVWTSAANAGGMVNAFTVKAWDGAAASTTAVQSRVPVIPKASNLKLWLKADAGVTKDGSDKVSAWADQSGNSNDASQGTAADQPTWVSDGGSGLNNKAVIRYNSHCLTTPSPGPILGDFTVFVTFKDNGVVSQWERLVDKDYAAGFYLARNYISANIWGGGIEESASPYGHFATMSDSSAHILTLQRQGTAKKLFSDGAHQSTNTVSAANTSNVNFGIGCYQYNYAQQRLTGDIAEVLIYNAALSTSERQKIEAYLGVKYGITTIPSTNQKLWLKADAGVYSDAGSTAAANSDTVQQWNDQSGNSFNASQSTAASKPTYVTNVLNGKPVLRFDGGDYLAIPYSATLNPSALGISMTTRVTGGAGSYRSPLSCRDSGPRRGYMFYANDSDRWAFWNGDNDATADWVITGSANATLNQWNLLSGQTGGATQAIYVDGSLNAVTASSYTQNTAREMRIGAGANESSANFFFTGDISEVLLFNTEPVEADRQRTEMYLSEKYGLPSSTMTPLDIPGLALWLKADAGITKDGSNKISAWADQSGNGQHTVQATAANQPTWVSNIVNGYPVTRYAGSQWVATSAVLPTSGAAARTMSFAFQTTTTAAGNAIGYGAEAIGQLFDLGPDGNSTVRGHFYGGGFDTATGAPSHGTNVWHVISILYDGTTVKVYRDGSLGNQKDLALNTASTAFLVGSGVYTALSGLVGDIAEVTVYSAALSTGDRTTLECYLARKYNITATITTLSCP